MRKNILLLEDKPSHREALYKIISGIPGDIRIHMASDVQRAYQIVMDYHIHLFLVDIILRPELPEDVLGLRFAQRIREIKRYRFTPLVFITSLEDPQLYSYKQLHCLRYIEKPFDPEQVKSIVLEALEFPTQDDEERFAYFRKDGIIYAKHIQDIIYVETKRRKSVIHCKNDVLEVPYQTSDEILRQIDSEHFVRCSRYAIINIKYIEYVDFTNRYIKLKYVTSSIEIGNSMKTKLKERLESGVR